MRDRLIEQLDTFCQKELGTKFNKDILDKFADYLLANGVIVPPCKVGDDIYIVKDKKVVVANVACIIMFKDSMVIEGRYLDDIKKEWYKFRCPECCFKDVIFSTREEAEKALQEVKGK